MKRETIGDPPPDTTAYLRPNLPMLGLDVETTGADRCRSGIVQLGMVIDIPGRPRKRHGVIVNCPEEIEPGAAEVHGITEERKRAEGVPLDEALASVGTALQWALNYNVLVTMFNAQFDWTVLGSSAARQHTIPQMEYYLHKELALYDPLVVSRTLNRYKKGGHKLGTLMEEAKLLGDLDGEQHDATFDAEAAVVLARHQLRRYPQDLGGVPLRQSTALMRQWHGEWAANFQAWLRKNRDPEAVMFMEWPFSDEEYRRAMRGTAEPADDAPPFEPTGTAE